MAGKGINDDDLNFLTGFTVFSSQTLWAERVRAWTAHAYLLLYTNKLYANSN
jgi:hypothetical protein